MEQAKNGTDKQLAYQQSYRLLKKAMQEEFYLEALSISYAVLEDRLVSFLHHAGIVSRNHPELNINKPVYPYLRILINKDTTYIIKIKDISVKIEIIRALLKMDENRAKEIDTEAQKIIDNSKRKPSMLRPGYMQSLYQQIHSCPLDIDQVTELLADLENWRKTRNTLIHALLNQKVSSSEQSKKECAETGEMLARAFDSKLVKPFKVKNNIRKKYNVQ